MLKQKCVSCGKTFTLTDSEIAFYKSKNLQLPKRCEACREKRNEIEKRSRKNFFIKILEKIRTRDSELDRVQNSFDFKFKNTEELKEHFI